MTRLRLPRLLTSDNDEPRFRLASGPPDGRMELPLLVLGINDSNVRRDLPQSFGKAEARLLTVLWS